jgi:hypothetical protein
MLIGIVVRQKGKRASESKETEPKKENSSSHKAHHHHHHHEEGKHGHSTAKKAKVAWKDQVS